MVSGQDNDAAIGHVLLENFLDLCNAFTVKCGEWLVKNPYGGIGGEQSGQCNAAILSGREVAAWYVFIPAQGEAGKNLIEITVTFWRGEGLSEVEILQCSQLALDAVMVAKVSRLCIVVGALFGDVGAIPENSPFARHHDAAEQAQQAGFSTAIAPLDLEDFPGWNLQSEVVEEYSVTPDTLQIHD